MISLKRPLVLIDLETTGADPATARIIEFAAQRLLPDGSLREVWSQRFNPGCPIPDEATAVHGITNLDVEHAPSFTSTAKLLLHGLSNCDLAGYNLRNFDIPVLWEEFHRAGLEWDLAGVRVIDVEKIFKRKEERTLSAAVRFFCDRSHDDAHGAAADVAATMDVLEAQFDRYPEMVAMSMDELDAFPNLDDRPRIDLAGKLVRDPEGFAVYAIGKVKGKRLADHPDFAEWMLGRDFSANTKMHIRRELDRVYGNAYAAAPLSLLEPFVAPGPSQ